MTAISSASQWLFSPPAQTGGWRSIAWWETRRIPINIILGIYGLACFALFFWAILTSHVLQPGQDAIEPLALIAAPIAFNICYTLGWLIETPARKIIPSLSPRFAPLLLKLGLGFSLCLISIPAIYWTAYRLLQLAHFLK